MFALLLSTVLMADPPVPKEALPPPKEAPGKYDIPMKPVVPGTAPAPAACADGTCGTSASTEVMLTERGRFRVRERSRGFFRGRRSGGCSSGG